MTFEKVIEIFKEQFEIDKDIEVANFRRGYQIFIWDSRQECYIPNDELIQTPERLFEELLDETRRFYKIKYRKPGTETVDDVHKLEIERIIAELKNKYSQSV